MNKSILGARCAIFGTYSLARSTRSHIGIATFLMLLLAAISPLGAHEFKAGDLEIGHPWSRQTPEGAKVAAGYAVVTNTGAAPDRLMAASAEIAGKAEIHEMSIDANGVMTMRPVEGGVEVPAGGMVELKPGGLHLMFMDLKQGIKEGERFKGTLTFERAGVVDVEFAVEAIGAGGEHDNHGG